ncbi:MAG: carbohydrate binding family 9 domain-containing protein, partial [Bacteroidota bacterium]
MLLLLGLALKVVGQNDEVLAHKASSPIRVDGRLSERDWQEGRPISYFQMTYPHDTLQAKSKTIVQVLFDDRFLYIGAICEDQIAGDYVVQSLKRDFDFAVNDAFAVFIDAFSDATNGLGFAVNPYGVQWDGIIANGGNKGVTTTWDGLWYAEVWQHPLETYWSVEMAIPLKTLRFKSSAEHWRINFARNDLKRNELSTFVPIPRGFEVATLNRMAKLVWESPPQKPGPNITLIPYLA